MTWDAFHRREAVLRAAIDLAEQRRDGVLAWDEALAWNEVPGAPAAYASPDDLLRALQMRWHTRLAGAIERSLTDHPGDLERAVVHAWRRLAAQMAGVRAVLDAHAGSRTLTSARHKELVLLASAAGRAGIDDPGAARIGDEIEKRARAITVETATAPAHGSLLSRLRQAFAA